VLGSDRQSNHFALLLLAVKRMFVQSGCHH
jgi:hypothetical protein